MDRENGEKSPSAGKRDDFEVPGSSKLAQDGAEGWTTGVAAVTGRSEL